VERGTAGTQLATEGKGGRSPAQRSARHSRGALTLAMQSAFVDARRGSLPLLLTAPHGGIEQPDGVPERSSGLRRLDGRTRLLGEQLYSQLEVLLGGTPYIVLARFHRRYLDANRPAEIGMEHEAARPHYDAYHGAIRGFVSEIRARFGSGLLLDLHGQSAAPQMIFRGTQNGVTTHALLEDRGFEALAGPESLFGQLETFGYQVVPSASSNALLDEQPGWSGGYTVQTYGSHRADGIDAMQIELGWDLRTKEYLPHLVEDLAAAIASHYRAYGNAASILSSEAMWEQIREGQAPAMVADLHA
jgi:N-formylglutamate amidohydrolase